MPEFCGDNQGCFDQMSLLWNKKLVWEDSEVFSGRLISELKIPCSVLQDGAESMINGCTRTYQLAILKGESIKYQSSDWSVLLYIWSALTLQWHGDYLSVGQDSSHPLAMFTFAGKLTFQIRIREWFVKSPGLNALID